MDHLVFFLNFLAIIMETVQSEMTALLSANVFLDGMALTVRRVSGETYLK